MANRKGAGQLDKFLDETRRRVRPSTLEAMPEVRQVIERYVERVDAGTTNASAVQLREFLAQNHGFGLSVSTLRNWINEVRDAKTQG